MKTLLSMIAVMGLLATPALAGGHGKGQQQGQGQLQGQGQKQTSRNQNTNRATASQGQSQDDSTRVEGSWGFSYVDVPTGVPGAVISPDAVVLSDSWKLGPLFGHSSQELQYLPAGVQAAFVNVLLARGAARPSGEGVQLEQPNEPGYINGEVALAMQTALCAHDRKTAKQLLLTCVED